jgi:hypothetical protein
LMHQFYLTKCSMFLAQPESNLLFETFDRIK